MTKMADKSPLYQQIGEAVRRQVLEGALKPGDLLPPVREMAERWGCTPGTVQQAYKELARQGLVVSRPGQGTRIGATLPPAPRDRSPLRRAALVQVELHDFLPGAPAGVLDRDVHPGAVLVIDRRPIGPDTRVGKRRVAEPVAERKERLEAPRVVPAIPDKHTLAVARFAIDAREDGKRRSILDPLREGLGEFAGRVDHAGDHVGKRTAASLSTSPARSAFGKQ